MADTHQEEITSTSATLSDLVGVSAKIERAERAHRGDDEKPRGVEVLGWCVYELCSYFIHAVLVPIVFPLIISQISMPWPEEDGAVKPETEVIVRGARSLICRYKEVLLYSRLTSHSISINSAKYSPLEWTSISWAVGLALAAPALGFLSGPLDHGSRPTLIAFGAATVGAVFCLPAGFFRTVWIFPPYIAFIVAASTIAAAHHTRHLGVMVRSFTGPDLHRHHFPLRRAASGWLSAAATAAGCLGAAVISAFAYHMLREREELMSLWIVSIFSGLKWLLGSLHFLVTAGRFIPAMNSSETCHSFSIFRFPHALGSLITVFLSSFATMSVFIGAVLYLVGELCLSPKSLLYLWLIYFLFPIISLPALHPIQHLIRASAVKMLLLGLFVVAAISGLGFSLRRRSWDTGLVLVFAAVQGSAGGVLHAFGRVLLLDCTPQGKEAVFSAWLVWARAAGSCVGFAVASAAYGRVGVSFGVAFLAAAVAVAVLIFGNVSDLGGAVAARHVRGDEYGVEKEEIGSPVNGVDARTSSIQETP